MPGRQSGDNKLSLTPYIVGKVTGDGCLYGGATAIQDAIDDAFAAGGGVVGIRADATPYVENLTFRAGVDLYGFCVDGRLPSFIGAVVIEGNHTFTQVGGFGATLSQYITYSAPAGDAFTITTTGGGQAILAMKFSGVEAQTVAGQRICVMNPDAGSSCQFSTDNANIGSDSHCFENIGLGSGSAFLSLGSINSSSGDVFSVSAGGQGSINGQWTQVSAGSSILNCVTGVGSTSFTHCDLFSLSEVALFGVLGGSADVRHSTMSCGAVSGNWVDGPVGSVTFGDILLSGSAQSIGAAISQTKVNWQPYAETAAAAIGSNRGTASFENIAFQAIDGFVSLSNSITGAVTALGGDTGTATPTGGLISIVGGAGVTTSASGSTVTIDSVVWSDVAAPVTVTVNSGTIDTVGGTAITLPAAPNRGDEARIISVLPGTVVTANAGQQIQIGAVLSSVGGTATGTAAGDTLYLTWSPSGVAWFSIASTGNWTLA